MAVRKMLTGNAICANQKHSVLKDESPPPSLVTILGALLIVLSGFVNSNTVPSTMAAIE